MPKVPDEAKQPADHEPKAEEPEALKPRVVSVNDTSYTISPEALDDFELLDDLNELDRTSNPVHIASVLRRLLGSKQMRTAMDTLRDPESGRVGIDAGSDFVSDLLEALNPN